MTFYLRNPEAVIVTDERGTLVLSRGQVHAVPGLDRAVLTALLQRSTRPLSHVALLELVDEPSVGLLCELGLLVTGSQADLELVAARTAGQGATPIAPHLVVGISGAIGAAEMLPTLRRLRPRFERVDVILTAAARRFVSPEAFEYCDLPVWQDEFARRGDVRVAHIHLARAATVLLVMPASAHTIFKLAHSTCSDLLSLTVAATTAPVVIVPAMNETMWCNPGVVANVERLRRSGHHIVEPGFGLEVAAGVAAEPTIGGAGVGPSSVAALLAAVLAARADVSAGTG